MKKLNIAIGADHRGYTLKEALKKMTDFNNTHIDWIDVGAFDSKRSDYPLFAIKAVDAMKDGRATKAILLCGSGNGMAITANRFKGIHACVAWNEEFARLAKEDDNCNVLVLPADILNEQQALSMIEVWLSAEFKNGRYEERLKMIQSIK